MDLRARADEFGRFVVVVEVAMSIESAIGCHIGDQELDQVMTLRDMMSVVAPYLPRDQRTPKLARQIVLDAVLSCSNEGHVSISFPDDNSLDLDKPILDVLDPDRFKR